MKTNPLRLAGAVLAVLAVAVVAIGGVNLVKANQGLASLDAVYRAQDVQLSYDEDGALVDRGTTEGAQAILELLEDDWAYPVNHADLDPSDPLVDTPTELMFQYATISYHILNGTQTVTLPEPVEYDGELFAAGDHEFAIDGRYWTGFDRSHPLEGPAREMAWGGAHGILASISAGVVADATAGFAHFAAWRTMLVGLALLVAAAGMVAAGSPRRVVMVQASAATEPAVV